MTQPSEGLVAVAVLHVSTGGIAEAAHEIASSAALRKLLIYEFPLLADCGLRTLLISIGRLAFPAFMPSGPSFDQSTDRQEE